MSFPLTLFSRATTLTGTSQSHQSGDCPRSRLTCLFTLRGLQFRVCQNSCDGFCRPHSLFVGTIPFSYSISTFQQDIFGALERLQNFRRCSSPPSGTDYVVSHQCWYSVCCREVACLSNNSFRLHDVSLGGKKVLHNSL